MGLLVLFSKINALSIKHSLSTRNRNDDCNKIVCFGRVGAVLHIILLVCSIPVTILFIISHYVQNFFGNGEKNDNAVVRTIQSLVTSDGKRLKANTNSLVLLISGAHFGKTLTVMRSIKAAKPDAKIVLTDSPKYALNGARFSRYCDAFEVIHADPEKEKEAYAEEMLKVAQKYHVTGYIPVSIPSGAEGDALACEVIEKHCPYFNRPYHLSKDVCALLDDKHAFCSLCEKLEIPAPKTIILSSEQDALKLNEQLCNPGSTKLPMIIKNLSYDPLHRLDLFTLPAPEKDLRAYLDKIRKDGNLIEKSQPWIAQTKLNGKEFSAALVIRDGQIRLLTISPSSASQLQFEHVSHTKIENWVKRFVSGVNKMMHDSDCSIDGLLNCQICIDFIEIESRNGSPGETEVLPIECNCRVHSQLSVFSTSQVGRVVLGAALLGVNLADCVDHNNNPRKNSGQFPMPLQSNFNLSPLLSLSSQAAGKTYHFADELFKLLKIPNYGHQRITTSPLGQAANEMKDADLDLYDPLPFFLKIHLQIPSLLVHNLNSGKLWKKIDFCIGKVVELDGE